MAVNHRVRGSSPCWGAKTEHPVSKETGFFYGDGMWYIYLCDRKGQLYTGITTNLSRRMKQHGAELLYTKEYPDKHSAAKREKQIKGWTRKKKLALIGNRR